jgi:hypothetical protein
MLPACRLDTAFSQQHTPLWNGTEAPMGKQEHRIERRLAAIFAADVAAYSRLMEQDEVGTLRTLTAYRQIMDRLMPSMVVGSPTPLATVSWPSSRALWMRVQCAICRTGCLCSGGSRASRGQASFGFGLGCMSVT